MSDAIDPARFAPPLSFMGECYGHDLAGAAAVIVGLPFDVGIDSHCAGARGPCTCAGASASGTAFA